MKLRYLIVSCLLPFMAGSMVLADTVETKDGARIVGKVVQIDGSTVVVDTEYAGSIKIKQSEVVSITTEKPSNIRLTTGTVLQGTVAGIGSGALIISGPDGSLHSSVDKVVATWAPGGKDPEVVALQRTWTYEAAVDIVGKTGNSEQLGTGFNFRAVLTGSQDKLEFYSGYDRQVTEGEISSDQFKAGIDYQNSFAGRYSWYLRDEAGFDRVKLIEFSNIAAAGLGYDFIKKPKQTFTGRLGVAHRFESYRADPVALALLIDPARAGGPLPADVALRAAKKENVNSAGLDVSLNHSLELRNFSIVTRINYVPAFEDFADFRAMHETFLQLPLANPAWKFRLGVVNDYNSKPAGERRNLDTTYYSRLVLTWR